MTTRTEVAALIEEKRESLAHRVISLIDRHPVVVLPLWIIAYFSVLWHAAHRPLWYDELFTYNVSMSPTFEVFWARIRHVDLNPPLIYLFVRSSIALFGDTPFVTRIPSLLAYLGASLIVFQLMVRRFGGGIGLAALGIFWSFSLTSFAVEARTYSLLLALFTIAMLCWLNAAEASRWTKWHAGLAASIVGMLLTHCFSPLFAAAIGFGELVRAVVSRRIDKRVWIVLVAPLSLVPLYIPLVRNAHSYLLPPAFDATLSTAPWFYLRIFFPVLPVVCLMLVLGIGGRKWKTTLAWRDLAQPHELAFSIATLALPAIIISYCYWSGLAFFGRYGIGAALGGCLILTALLAKITRRRVDASVASAVIILLLFCWTRGGTKLIAEPYDDASLAYQTISPGLPFVAACGLTFLEMDHRESPDFAKRLFYLTDMESAMKYTRSNGFESYPTLRRWVPIRANIAQYHEFVKHNPQFLVLASPDCPLEWLLMKLKDDGANVRLLQESKFGYRDRNLYEVTFLNEYSAVQKARTSREPSH